MRLIGSNSHCCRNKDLFRESLENKFTPSMYLLVMWPVKTCHMEEIDILIYQFWITLFSELFPRISCDTGIKNYWCSKAIKNKEKHKNCVNNFLYFAVSLCATCGRVSQITSHFGNLSALSNHSVGWTVWISCKVGTFTYQSLVAMVASYTAYCFDCCTIDPC